MTVENQRENVRVACRALSPVAMEHELVVSHGNGPQVGLLSLQASSYDEASIYPFDVLGAQTEGMIGYFIEQELGNYPFEKPIATILTMTEVDADDDPAMADPTVRGTGLQRGGCQTSGSGQGLDGQAGRRRVAQSGSLRSPSGSSRSARSRLCSTPEPWWSAPAAAASRPCICRRSRNSKARGTSTPVTSWASRAVIDKDRSSAVLAPKT